MAMLDPEARANVFAEVEKLLERDDSPLRDGVMSVPMTAHVFWARVAGG